MWWCSSPPMPPATARVVKSLSTVVCSPAQATEAPPVRLRCGDSQPLFVVDAHLVPDRCPPNRARFLAAAVRELDAELRTRGGRLIVRRGVV
ncbi:deoxyribodipyrimidine photo-lyase, partial [Nocardia farcinica]|uniref:deoxyribodipyrimidine photo-lyase n=1 Tax=Nocardia farcinica TaxID=37329 RepID=UPI00313E8230